MKEKEKEGKKKKKGKTLDNWLCFYLSERHVLAEVANCKSYFH